MGEHHRTLIALQGVTLLLIIRAKLAISEIARTLNIV
tara:strand:- start:1469 stop:1579 length:111 start_codon:yes stop_codon:yes gene_type:complete